MPVRAACGNPPTARAGECLRGPVTGSGRARVSAVAGTLVRGARARAREHIRRVGRLRAGRLHTGGAMPGTESLRIQRWISGSRQGRDRHRGEPRDRPRDRLAPRRGRGAVVLCARGAADLDTSVRAIAGPGRALGVVVDVTTPHGAAAVVEAAVEEFGGLDIVVNNVGGSGARTFRRDGCRGSTDVLGKNLSSGAQRLAGRPARAA